MSTKFWKNLGNFGEEMKRFWSSYLRKLAKLGENLSIRIILEKVGEILEKRLEFLGISLTNENEI